MAFDNRVNKIINKHTNQIWSPMDPDSLLQKVALKKTNIDYIIFEARMQGEFLKKINGIYRIQNPILYEQFKLKVAECNLFGNIKVKELFHSTANENVYPIIHDNFDWRVCHRTKFGQGISFSSDPSYANLQSNLKNGLQRAMIVADVIVGGRQIGNKWTVIPDDKFDTTVNEDNTVFVKYYDNEFYPKYVIYYETYPVITENGERFIKRYY